MADIANRDCIGNHDKTFTTFAEKLAQMNRVIVKTEEVEATFNWTDVFPASEKAVIIGEEKYAYPTLVFGNFIHAITPAALPDCPISSGTASFSEYETALEICKSNLMGEWSDYERLVSGKMIDQDGWYQPYIYLDGYVDLHGAENLQQGLEDLMNGVVDDTLCERLKWFTGLCHHNDSEPQNLCLDTTSDVATFIDDVVDHKGVLLYSSPEKLPLAVKKMEGSHRMIHGLGAVSMGNENVLLQFTESLVVSGDRWDEASSRKQSAIREFIEMFTSLQMRYNISSGFDLETPQNRYLLMPLMSFYSETDAADNPIYSDASDFLQNAIPAPPLEDPTTLHETLMSKCINIDNDSGKKTKSEL